MHTFCELYIVYVHCCRIIDTITQRNPFLLLPLCSVYIVQGLVNFIEHLCMFFYDGAGPLKFFPQSLRYSNYCYTDVNEER